MPGRSLAVVVAGAVSIAAACGQGRDESTSATGPNFGVGSGDAGDGEAEESDDGSPPMTPMECAEALSLHTQGDVCPTDCGPVLSCHNPYPDCFTCSEQCYAPGCSTDAECQELLGDLCPGVDWICTQQGLTYGCGIDWGGDDDDGSGSDACQTDAASECDGEQLVDCQTGDYYDCTTLCIDAGYDGVDAPACGPDENGEGVCFCVSESAGCDGGDPYECSGDQLYDCATGDLHDCQVLCVDAGYAGVGDPACGVGAEGWDVCLCS